MIKWMNSIVLGKQSFWLLRRYLLRHLVPSFIWPRYVRIDNVDFMLRDAPYSFGTKLLLWKGEYEASERRMINGHVLVGEQVIEMGGSIGILTRLIASRVGMTGKVISIEASTKITDYSKDELERMGNVKVLNGFGFPVYQANNSVSVEGFNDSAGSLGGIVTFSISKESKSTYPSGVAIYDLKTIVDLYEIVPTVLVIDIEGSEVIMTQLPLDFPKSIRIVLIELHPHLYADNQLNEIVDSVISEGFSLIEVDSNVYLFKRKIA